MYKNLLAAASKASDARTMRKPQVKPHDLPTGHYLHSVPIPRTSRLEGGGSSSCVVMMVMMIEKSGKLKTGRLPRNIGTT